MIGAFFEAKHYLSLCSKFELVRFYLSVAVLRIKVADDQESLEKPRTMSEWEATTKELHSYWPWGERIMSPKAIGPPTPTPHPSTPI